MEQENKGKGIDLNVLTKVLFGNGVLPSTQYCFGMLVDFNSSGKDKLAILHKIWQLCADITNSCVTKIPNEVTQAMTISSIVQATYIVCQDQPNLRIKWLQMLHQPLQAIQPEGHWDPFRLESYAYGAIIGMLHCLNEHTWPASDQVGIQQNYKIEKTFSDILCELISQPGAQLNIILPGDKTRSEINRGLEKYINSQDPNIPLVRTAIIYKMLTQIRRNLTVEKDPWAGKLLNFHFSKQLLEKLLYAMWGSFSLMEMLSYFVEGGLRCNVKTSPTATGNQDDLTGLTQEFEEDLPPETEFPVADGDYQTHFDLGIAFKEMGEFEQAIGEFEVAN